MLQSMSVTRLVRFSGFPRRLLRRDPVAPFNDLEHLILTFTTCTTHPPLDAHFYACISTSTRLQPEYAVSSRRILVIDPRVAARHAPSSCLHENALRSRWKRRRSTTRRRRPACYNSCATCGNLPILHSTSVCSIKRSKLMPTLISRYAQLAPAPTRGPAASAQRGLG